VHRIEGICETHGVDLPAAALQYPDQSPLVASTLIGTTKASSLKRNLEQFKSPLSSEFWADLRDQGVIGDPS